MWWRARINNNMHPIFQYCARKELTKAAPDIFSNQIGWKLQMILQSARACPPNQSGSSIVTVGPILWRRWEIWFELSILSLSREKFYCSNISARNLHQISIASQNVVWSSGLSFDKAGCVTAHAEEERVVYVSISLCQLMFPNKDLGLRPRDTSHLAQPT